MFEDSTLTAGSVMTADVVTISPQTSLRAAARLMASRGISALPVVEADGTVVGLLSEADLVRPNDAAVRRRDWWLQHLADGHDLAPEFLAAIHAMDQNVGHAMQRDVASVSEMASLKDVALQLVGKNIRRLLVLREGKLAGIVSRADLVKAIAAGAA